MRTGARSGVPAQTYAVNAVAPKHSSRIRFMMGYDTISFRDMPQAIDSVSTALTLLPIRESDISCIGVVCMLPSVSA